MFDLEYPGALKLLRYKREFVILNFAVSVKFILKKYRMFAGDSQTLLNKHHFVISVIAINVFYCIIFTSIHKEEIFLSRFEIKKVH